MSQILQKVAPIGEMRDKELLKSASTYVYDNSAGFDLLAHVFSPEGPTTSGRPVVAFFHGGFWDASMVTQFVPHCHHFASRGAVAVTFEYRISSKHQTSPIEAVEDSVAAIQWLQENAELLGIDSKQIALGGAAGGAWLALLLAMRKDKDTSLQLTPKALLLFSPLVNTTPKGQLSERFPDNRTASKFSPSRHIRRKLPPMLLMHGKSDRVLPFDDVASFRRRMKWRGNRCKLLDFTGAEHSFFNFNVSHRNFEMTINAADHFLVEQGLLAPIEPDEPST